MNIIYCKNKGGSIIKKFLFCLTLFFCSVLIPVNASSNYAAKIGDNYYDSLKEAIANASSTDIIMLTSNTSLDETLTINKTININLNGHNITAPSKVFEVEGGTLNLSGKGTIKETIPNYGAIMVIGSTEQNDTNYSVVNVGEDVTLEGWSGIFIKPKDSSSYGVTVNIDGTINAIKDTSGGNGVGVYVNGNIKHQENIPIVNIGDNAKITSDGNGLYIAGNAIFNIKKAYISGMEAGIGIKSGTLNINGATVESLGEDYTPTEGYNNGIKASGTALQIESNNGYAGNMKIKITDGNFKSKNSNVIYEYIGKGTTTQVNSLDISGGTFKSDAAKDVFLLSNSLKEKHPSFITGGKYSSNPNAYLESGYSIAKDNNLFNVVKSTMKEIFSSNNETGENKSPIKVILIIITIIIFIFISYFNRTKIINFLKKISG